VLLGVGDDREASVSDPKSTDRASSGIVPTVDV